MVKSSHDEAEETESKKGQGPPTPGLVELTRRVKAAILQYHTVLATTQLVCLAPKSQDRREAPEAQLVRQAERLLKVKSDLEKAQDDLLAYVKSKPGFGAVKSDMTTFASTRTAHKLNLEKTPDPRRLLGCITLPRSNESTTSSSSSIGDISSNNHILRVSSSQFRALISAILPPPN